MAIISSDVATGRKMNWRDGFTARRVQVFPNDPVFLRSQQEALSLGCAKASRRVCKGHTCPRINQTTCAKTTESQRHREKACFSVFSVPLCLWGSYAKCRFHAKC